MTKVLPSPDWVVGVSSLSLCNVSTWLPSLSLHLHLVDLGILGGLSYESESSVQREPIHRITSSFPDNENSPFFNDAYVGVKPFARLSFHKLKSGY